jgi:hypothetical protein
MGWASQYVAGLNAGETVRFRPRGDSMRGKIESGQLCTVEPVDPATLAVGDIVLCKVNGFQIGNNRGRINGWISANTIFGKCVRIE